MALKAQFEPLSKEERAHNQIRKLTQTRNVHNYICCFKEVKNEIPSAEVYCLFVHGLNPQLRQILGTLVSSGDVEEVVEVVTKVTV